MSFLRTMKIVFLAKQYRCFAASLEIRIINRAEWEDFRGLNFVGLISGIYMFHW